MSDIKATHPVSCATTGISIWVLQLCAFSPSHNFSKIFSPNLPPPPIPRDLFMGAESLNSSSLYSSEAARWQLLISMLIIFPQPGKAPLHRQSTEAETQPCPSVSYVRWRCPRGGGGVGGVHLNELHQCIHGKQRKTNRLKSLSFWVDAEKAAFLS